MQRTKVRLERAPTVFIMMVRMSFSDFHDFASLNTLVTMMIVLIYWYVDYVDGYLLPAYNLETRKVRERLQRSFKELNFLSSAHLNPHLSRRKDLSIESPETPSASSSTRESATIRKSKQFQPSWWGGGKNIASSFPWTLDSGKFKQILKNGNLEDWSGLKDPVKVKIQTVSKAENFKPFEDAKPTKVTINQRDPFWICCFSICRPAAGRREPI